MIVEWDDVSTAVRSARTLLKLGDTRGAANRAHYAMFDAARAALEKIDPYLLKAKTHQGILRNFSKYVIRDQGADQELSRALRQALAVRIESDYEGQRLNREQVMSLLISMDTFVEAVGRFVGASTP